MVSCFNVPSIHPGSHVHVGVNTGTRFSYKFMCIDNVFIRHLILGVYVLGLRVRTCAILELYRYFPQKIFADLQPLFVIFLFIGASNSCCHRKLLLTAWEGKPIEAETLDVVCDHYADDLDRNHLASQLGTMENLNENIGAKDIYPEAVRNKVLQIIQTIAKNLSLIHI